MLTAPQKTPQFSQIVIDIDDVDLANRTVTGHDKTNVLIQASFREAPGAALRIPVQGEKWTVQRIGYQWRLGQRLDSPDEHATLTEQMTPGDSRLAADGTMHIASDAIVYNNQPVGATTWNVFDADGIATSFTLDIAPVHPQTVQAFMNGLLIDPRIYTVVDAVVTFLTAPATGTLVVYFQRSGYVYEDAAVVFGKAVISGDRIVSATQTATAKIVAVRTKTQPAAARILTTRSVTQSATAQIASTVGGYGVVTYGTGIYGA